MTKRPTPDDFDPRDLPTSSSRPTSSSNNSREVYNTRKQLSKDGAMSYKNVCQAIDRYAAKRASIDKMRSELDERASGLEDARSAYKEEVANRGAILSNLQGELRLIQKHLDAGKTGLCDLVNGFEYGKPDLSLKLVQDELNNTKRRIGEKHRAISEAKGQLSDDAELKSQKAEQEQEAKDLEELAEQVEKEESEFAKSWVLSSKLGC
ncbi:hypothetical protein KCU65_g6917, partial [Aureobasidium melanogenum]